MLEKMKEMLAEQLNCESINNYTGGHLSRMILEQILLTCLSWLWLLRMKYNVEIPAEELTDLNTVGDVIDYLKNKGVEA